MKCAIAGCPGEYEHRQITHTLRRNGQVLVFDDVPADVCNVCGDVLLSPDTIRRLERMMNALPRPTATIPLYRYSA